MGELEKAKVNYTRRGKARVRIIYEAVEKPEMEEGPVLIGFRVKFPALLVIYIRGVGSTSH